MTKEKRDEFNERVVGLLEELLKWTRVTSIPGVNKLLVATLQNDIDKLAYHNSDGRRTSRDVGAIVNLGKDAITSRWKSWIRLGIAERISVGSGGRAKRLFSLADFSIDVPDLKEKNENNNKTHLEEESDE